MKNRGLTLIEILIAVGVVAILGVGVAALISSRDTGTTARPTLGCTQEAKICPGGSSVGRTGPNCEFAECPGSDGILPTAIPNSVGEEDPITILEPNKAETWIIGEQKRISWKDDLGRHSEKATQFSVVFVPESDIPAFGYTVGLVSNSNFFDWTVGEYESCGVGGCEDIILSEGRYFVKIQIGPSHSPIAVAQSDWLVEIVSHKDDWQIYRNEEHGFEVKHPPGFTSSEFGGGDSPFQVRFSSSAGGVLEVLVYEVNQGVALDDAIHFIEDVEGVLRMTATEDIVVSGVSARRVEAEQLSFSEGVDTAKYDPPRPRSEVFFVRGDRSYLLHVPCVNTSLESAHAFCVEGQNQNLDDFVSTFKFVE